MNNQALDLIRQEIRTAAITQIYIKLIDDMRKEREITDEFEMHQKALEIATGIYDGIANELSLRP